MTELRPCPFCGGNAKLMDAPDVWVECTSCGAQSRMCAMPETALERWNVRVTEEEPARTHKQNLFKVCFRMSDGQVFEKEFRSFAEAIEYVHDVKGLKALFCIEGKTFEDVTWINPRQIVSAEVMRVL